MRKFIVDIIIILSMLVVASICVDLLFSKFLQKSRSKMLDGWNEIISQDIDANMLIVGSSRALVQYSPRVLDSVLGVNSYNMGLDGCPFHRQYAKYRAYVHYQSKPQCVVLNIDHFLFRYEDEYEREHFFPYLVNPILRKFILPVQRFTWCELYLPSWRYLNNGGFLYFMNKYSCNDHLYKGFQERREPWDRTFMQKLENKSVYAKIDKRSVACFENFLKDTQKDSINVIFCYAPMYIGNTIRVANRDELISLVDGYASHYNIPILDYTYSAISYDTTFFYNISHLNYVGAEKFSRNLAIDIDSLCVMWKD